MTASVPRLRSRGILTWSAAALLSSLLAVTGLVLQSWLVVLPIGAVMLVLLFGYTLANPPRALGLVLIVAGAAGLPLGARGIELGVRIYPLDFVVAVLLAAMVVGIWLDPNRWTSRWPLQLPFLLLLVYFTASLILGLLVGNDPRTAFGDYRRLAAYPLMLLVFAAAIQTPRDSRTLLYALVIAGYATFLIGVVRIVSGTGFAEELLAGTTIRYLSYVEAATAGLGVLAAAGFARSTHGRARIVWYALAVPPFLAVLVSNYRTAWAALALGLIIQSLSLGWKRGMRLLGLAFVIMVPVTVLMVTQTGFGGYILDRFDLSNLSSSGLWRYFSWATAFDAFAASPAWGTGMGYAHQFESFNIGAGVYSQFLTSSIHNDPLAFLVNTGLVGLTLAITFVVPWTSRAIFLAQSPEPDASLIGSTALGGLALMTAVSCLQPFFSTAATISIAMALLAIVIRTPVPPPEVPAGPA